jgi:hypothetical protein
VDVPKPATGFTAFLAEVEIASERSDHEEGESGLKEGKEGDSPSQLIDASIKELSDWRGETLARVRILIKPAEPEVVEEWRPRSGSTTVLSGRVKSTRISSR